VSDIALCALNARYSHASFGLRYLRANLGPLRDRAELLEFHIKQCPADIADRILALRPRVAGLGIFIWNLAPCTEVVRRLKAARPDLVVVLGGPEVSFPSEQPEICRLADYVIGGEGDTAFAELCGRVLSGRAPPSGFIAAPPADLGAIALPYGEYSDEDIAHRTVYVETSRGCAFDCEFCLSSLDVPVRRFPTERLFHEFDLLLRRGVRAFKFVDRTFNLSAAHCRKVLRFFLDRHEPDVFLHFEMMPDRLTEGLRADLAAFPAGAIQLEVGIQTFNPEVAQMIKRRQDYAMTEENLRWLLLNTGAYLHADLIAGLPGETPASFAAGFDRLAAIGPHEIQVNILKRLRGTTIDRHSEAWEMIFADQPPYELLRNRLMDEETVRHLKRFAKYWDLVVNSGKFAETAPLLWRDTRPAFDNFSAFTRWLHARLQRTHGIALDELARHVFDYLVAVRGNDAACVAAVLRRDYGRTARRRPPPFLGGPSSDRAAPVATPLPAKAFSRQARRLMRVSGETRGGP
jgi:radical SAM superfamily enzyme YgiQ (UPF0313 family)